MTLTPFAYNDQTVLKFVNTWNKFGFSEQLNKFRECVDYHALPLDHSDLSGLDLLCYEFWKLIWNQHVDCIFVHILNGLLKFHRNGLLGYLGGLYSGRYSPIFEFDLENAKMSFTVNPLMCGTLIMRTLSDLTCFSTKD